MQTTVEDVMVSRIPDDRRGACPVREGMTVRQATRALRAEGAWWLGDIGTTNCMLSDGTHLSVELQDASEGNGALLMSSQRIVRRGRGETARGDMRDDMLIRVYPW